MTVEEEMSGLSIDERFGLDEGHSYSIPGRGKTGERDIDHRSGHAALKAIGDVFGGSLYASGSDETNLLPATDVGRDRALEDRLRRAEADRDDAQAQVRNMTAQLAEERHENTELKKLANAVQVWGEAPVLDPGANDDLASALLAYEESL